MDNLPTHRDIIAMWPDLKELAADAGCEYLAVRKWRERNFIPAKYWVRLVTCAHERDYPLTYKILAESINRQSVVIG